MKYAQQRRDSRVAELRAQAHFLERGWDVRLPAVDDGVDFFANGLAVQVKSSRINPATNNYTFSLGVRARSRTYETVDLFVFHGRDGDLWIVVPREALGALPDGIALHPDPSVTRGRWSWLHTYTDAWPPTGAAI